MKRASVLLVVVAGCGYPDFQFRGEDAVAGDVALEVDVEDGTTTDAADAAESEPVDAPADAEDDVADTTPALPTSCAALHATSPALASGAYTIDPDGDGPTPPFEVYCEMSADGGGWTLAAKLDGAKKTWAYDQTIWTDDGLLGETSTNLDPVEAKLASFTTMPFTKLRVGMLDGGVGRFVVLDVARSSLKNAFAGGVIATSAGRAKWFSIVADGALQWNCSAEGFNQDYGTATYGARPKIRLGIVGNNESDCSSPDSYLGFGAGIANPTSCYGGSDPGVVVGNVSPAMDTCGSPKAKATTTFGFVFLR